MIDDQFGELRIRGALASTWALIGRYPIGIVAGTIGLATLDTGLEVASGGPSLSLIGNVAAIAAVFVIYRDLFRKEGMIVEEGRFSSYFGASLLSGFAVVLASLLFIVPGLYLIGRWALASGMVLTRNARATESLRESWRATARCGWKITGLYTLCVGVWGVTVVLIGGGGAILATFDSGLADTIDTSPAFLFLLNAAANLGVVAGAYLGVAVFGQVIGGRDTYREVFA